jgi:hypothetical protein
MLDMVTVFRSPIPELALRRRIARESFSLSSPLKAKEEQASDYG